MLVRRLVNGDETHREREYTEQKCHECGGFKFDRKSRKRYLYRFSITQLKGWGASPWHLGYEDKPLHERRELTDLETMKFEDPHLFCDSWCREAFYKKE